MKRIELLNLKLVNFKGIKSFEFNAAAQDVRVFGDNGTGKTTLFDAFNWLLFDKDSQNSSKFEVKNLVDGKPISKIEHEVEAIFQVDDESLTLKKVFKEKWTKRRGSITADFSGHTTDYFVSEVPSSKKEYTDAVAELIKEDVFKLLTSSAYFNEHLHWKERRSLLLEVAGDVTDEEVIQSDKKLEKLMDVLNGRSVEDQKKVIAGKRKEINEEIERIPIRIDEIHRGLPDLTGLIEIDIKELIHNASEQIEKKQEQISSIKSGSEVNKLKAQISDLDLQLTNARNEHSQQGQQDLYKYKSRMQEEESNFNIIKSKLDNVQMGTKHATENKQRTDNALVELRQEWSVINAEEFTHESECECPTCGQDLPAGQIESAKEKAQEQFNLRKSKKLEDISAKGKQNGQQSSEYQVMIEKNQKETEKLNAQIEEKKTEINKIEKKIEQASNEVTPIEVNTTYMKLVNEKESLEEKIKTLNTSVQTSVHSVQEEINGLKEQQKELQIDLDKFLQVEQKTRRITELETQEKDLASQFEELEHQLYLTEEFIRTKVNMLENKINSKFKHARFKLFEQQINGGLLETCETTYEGVPYSSGLNNAARINVGLDIINTLSEHYGVQAPIFIDNAESITKLIDIESQVISLIVSELDKQLRVETKSEKEVA